MFIKPWNIIEDNSKTIIMNDFVKIIWRIANMILYPGSDVKIDPVYQDIVMKKNIR